MAIIPLITYRYRKISRNVRGKLGTKNKEAQTHKLLIIIKKKVEQPEIAVKLKFEKKSFLFLFLKTFLKLRFCFIDFIFIFIFNI